MALGVDYSSGVPKVADLKAQNVKFVCRYLAPLPNPKCITLTEANAMKAGGIDIVLVFESWANRALDGFNAGVSDATLARSQARAVGLSGAPIYFAVDFDATPAQQSPINTYLRGAASILGLDHVGVYGGFYVVKRALDAGVCKYAWQTSAWSGGQWDSRIHLKQLGGTHISGVACDYDYSQTADYGQATKPLPAPVPPPKPTPAPTPSPTPPPVTFPSTGPNDFWAWARWKDAGSPAGQRPAVRTSIQIGWVVRYWLHRGAPHPIPKAVAAWLTKKFPV